MSENKITFPVKLASNNPQSFGIVDATEISGHRSVDTISDLYSISDPVLSVLKDGSDAIGQEWFVVSEDCKYRLDNWENRKSVSGWTKLPKQELINTKQPASEKDRPNGYAGLDSNGKLPIEKTYGTTATVVDVATYESLPVTGLNGVIYYVSNTSAQYKWSGSAYIDITDGADNAKKNETSIFDCSNGTSTKYYSRLSDAINVVPAAYRTSNRIISYLSTENSTTSAVNYQYNGIDSTTWSDLTKWERIPNQTDLAEILYDVSSHNNGAVFESLQTLLGSANLSTLIPTSVRRGGMSIRFIQDSDNKYVQYRNISQNWSTLGSDWQKEFEGVNVYASSGRGTFSVSNSQEYVSDIIYSADTISHNTSGAKFEGVVIYIPKIGVSKNIIVSYNVEGSNTQCRLRLYNGNTLLLDEPTYSGRNLNAILTAYPTTTKIEIVLVSCWGTALPAGTTVTYSDVCIRFNDITDFKNDIIQVATDLSKLEQEQIQGGVYDVSSHNDGAVFESLSALLGSSDLNTLIPTSVQHGGMSIRFIQSSDNKYVRYRLMANSFSANVADWQGVDDEPTAGSNNLVKSSGVYKNLKEISTFEYVRKSGNITYEYKVNGGDGTATTDSDYNLLTYDVDGVEKVRILSHHVFQFQTEEGVSANPEAMAYRLVGSPVSGNYDEITEVPTGAKYLIISALNTDISAGAYDIVTIKEKIVENSKDIESIYNLRFYEKKGEKISLEGSFVSYNNEVYERIIIKSEDTKVVICNKNLYRGNVFEKFYVFIPVGKAVVMTYIKDASASTVGGVNVYLKNTETPVYKNFDKTYTDGRRYAVFEENDDIVGIEMRIPDSATSIQIEVNDSGNYTPTEYEIPSFKEVDIVNGQADVIITQNNIRAYTINGYSLELNIVLSIPFINVKEVGAKGDGIANDTIPFKIAISQSGDIYIPKGTYKIKPSDNPIVIPSNTHLIFDKDAFIVSDTPESSSSSLFKIEDESNIRIEGGVFIGTKDSEPVGDPHHHCFVVTRDCHNIVFSNVTIEKFFGDGIYVKCDGKTVDSVYSVYKPKNITISDCMLSEFGRNGISVTGVEFVNIDGCHITDAALSGIDLEPSDGAANDRANNNITITNCFLYNTTAEKSFNLATYNLNRNIIVSNCVIYNFASRRNGTSGSGNQDGDLIMSNCSILQTASFASCSRTNIENCLLCGETRIIGAYYVNNKNRKVNFKNCSFYGKVDFGITECLFDSEQLIDVHDVNDMNCKYYFDNCYFKVQNNNNIVLNIYSELIQIASCVFDIKTNVITNEVIDADGVYEYQGENLYSRLVLKNCTVHNEIDKPLIKSHNALIAFNELNDSIIQADTLMLELYYNIP